MTVVMVDRGRPDQQGRLVLMESAGRLDRLGRQGRPENKGRKAKMDDQPTKLPFKPGLLVVSPIGLPALLDREARKVNKALQESVESGEIRGHRESVENLVQQGRSSPLHGKRSLLGTLMILSKACLSFLVTVVILVLLYVLLEILLADSWLPLILNR